MSVQPLNLRLLLLAEVNNWELNFFDVHLLTFLSLQLRVDELYQLILVALLVWDFGIFLLAQGRNAVLALQRLNRGYRFGSFIAHGQIAI